MSSSKVNGHLVNTGDYWEYDTTMVDITFHKILKNERPSFSIHLYLLCIHVDSLRKSAVLTLSVRMTTLLPIFVHNALIGGPIDSKPIASEKELNLR
jgi:hypothetical protein